MSEYVIETRRLTKVYKMGQNEVKALDGVGIQIEQGEFVALMGSSGSGKSTLLHLLGCLDTPTAGTYTLEGHDVSGLSNDERTRVRNQRIGFIFQNFNLLARTSALENVSLPLLYRRSPNNVNERAQKSLEIVGLGNRANHTPVKLSGGERQRVAIARALITDPSIILADEPTGSLDSKTGNEIMELLVKFNNEGRTILVVTHDSHVASFAQRTIHMQDGKIINGSDAYVPR
jgi:putative ABC transport system ATP-binding protein